MQILKLIGKISYNFLNIPNANFQNMILRKTAISFVFIII